mmetsp:Transcript_2352/g.4388  ORF Transcript_2352/g.4388 Transcript_2352/m.4388 type:complete len:154 (+) Transcript_2352:1888-2349(+)
MLSLHHRRKSTERDGTDIASDTQTDEQVHSKRRFQSQHERHLLSLKGLEFGLIEVPRHDFRPESIDIVDTKRFVPLLPSDDVRKVLRMGVVQHRMELQRKGKASFLIVRTTATSPVRALLCLWFCCWRNHHGKSYVCGCETVCFSFYEAGVCG